jgi:hypothetical protein
MIPFSIETPRHKIADTFSRWTALSALRSGSPLKSRTDVYGLLEAVDLNSVLASTTPISSTEFEEWHEDALMRIQGKARILLPTGWAAKIVNVYLKSMTYLSGIGRPDLVEHIHPPIDSGLWMGLKKSCEDLPEIYKKVYHRNRIKDITAYEDYKIIIEGCREIARAEDCLLIEVEKHWLGTEYKN